MRAPVSRFWAGFGLASLLWAGAGAYLFYVEGFAPPAPVEAEPIAEAPEVEEAPEEEPAPRRRRRRRRRARAEGRQTPTGSATVGDDLGEDEMRTLDMGGTGGEQQLRPAQIESAFDDGMGGIRRCLVLIEGGADVRGRITFGLRIAPSGSVERVRLSGPRAATTGEAGGCLQRAARGLRFDSFDGPPRVVNYPITLE